MVHPRDPIGPRAPTIPPREDPPDLLPDLPDLLPDVPAPGPSRGREPMIHPRDPLVPHGPIDWTTPAPGPGGEGCDTIFECEDKRQDPDNPPASNGCSGLPRDSIPGIIDASSCCEAHDIAYSTCDGDASSRDDRGPADDEFCECLREHCEERFPNPWNQRRAGVICDLVADIMCSAVRNFGGEFYCKAQKKHCICCDEPNPDPDCFASM